MYIKISAVNIEAICLARNERQQGYPKKQNTSLVSPLAHLLFVEVFLAFLRTDFL